MSCSAAICIITNVLGGMDSCKVHIPVTGNLDCLLECNQILVRRHRALHCTVLCSEASKLEDDGVNIAKIACEVVLLSQPADLKATGFFRRPDANFGSAFTSRHIVRSTRLEQVSL